MLRVGLTLKPVRLEPIYAAGQESVAQEQESYTGVLQRWLWGSKQKSKSHKGELGEKCYSQVGRKLAGCARSLESPVQEY